MNLPQGWTKCNLTDLCIIRTGKYDANHAIVNGKYRFYTCSSSYSLCNTKSFEGECVIVPGNGDIGQVFYYNGEFEAYQRTYVLEKIHILPSYLYYHLFWNWRHINSDKQFGSTIRYVRIGNFENYIVFLPPIPEQHRIVAKIDTLFSELDDGIALLKTIKAQLTVYRQAVLKWAFEGKNKKIVQLCEIADIVGGITKGRNLEKYETIFLPYLSVANVQDGYLNLTNVKKIKLKLEEKEKYLLQLNDVLYTEGGDKDKLGRGTIWKNEIKECVHQNHIFRARIDTKKALPKYVALFSLTKSAKDYFFSRAKQTVNLASINMTVLRSLPIPLPSLNEQQAIISAIESRLSVCDKLEQTIDQTLALSASLRQSILKKAFEGRLVPQDPNDEPAEKLLERKKAEKAAMLAKQKQIRKRSRK